jgi:hypothetical protein
MAINIFDTFGDGQKVYQKSLQDSKKSNKTAKNLAAKGMVKGNKTMEKMELNNMSASKVSRKNISEDEIRARTLELAPKKQLKSADQVTLSTEAKLLAKNNELASPSVKTIALDAGPVAAVESMEKTPDIDTSVIKENNPADSNVYEKLRTVLAHGQFNFSEKEKDVLSKIIK